MDTTPSMEPAEVAQRWMRGPGRFNRITDRAELIAELDRFVIRKTACVLRKQSIAQAADAILAAQNAAQESEEAPR